MSVKFTRIIVLLVIVILGLITFILGDKIIKPNMKEDIAFCGTIDSMSIKIDSKINYRFSANFIDADFNPEKGRYIFNSYCASCHSRYAAQIIIGPALFDLFNHIPRKPKDWIFHYLKNSDSLALSGDSYVNDLREKYNIVKWNHTDSLLTKENMIDLAGFIGMNK